MVVLVAAFVIGLQLANAQARVPGATLPGAGSSTSTLATPTGRTNITTEATGKINAASRAPLPVTSEIARRLMAYSWPGNARELRNLVERALILGYFPMDGLPIPEANPAGVADALAAMSSDCTLEQIEKEHILRVLESVRGNKSEAARRLGGSRPTLERKCASWDMPRGAP